MCCGFVAKIAFSNSIFSSGHTLGPGSENITHWPEDIGISQACYHLSNAPYNAWEEQYNTSAG